MKSQIDDVDYETALATGGLTQQEFDLLSQKNPPVVGGGGRGGALQTDSSEERKAAYQKYEDWKEENQGQEVEIPPATTKDRGEHLWADDSAGVHLPDPNAKKGSDKLPGADTISGQGPTTATIAVDQHALRVFAENAIKFKEAVADAKLWIDRVSVAPGYFGAGFQLLYAIDGGEKPGNGNPAKDVYNKSLKAEVAKTLQDAYEAFTDIIEAAEETAKKYDTTEEMNKMTAEQLKDHFDESFKWVTSGDKSPPA